MVVTGAGAVTPLGVGLDVFWPRILAGESGVGPVTLMDVSAYPTRIAGEVKDFDAADWMDGKDARRVDRFIAFAAASAAMAVKDSCLDLAEIDKTEVGVLIGSGIGGLTFMGEQVRRLVDGGPSRVSPFLVPYMIPDMASGYVSIQHGFKGPNTCVVSACSTGADAIGTAATMIARGDAKVMLAGGTEAPVCEIGMSGFCSARAMTTNNDDPRRASRPFDAERDGFVIAEGSAVFMLEEAGHAVARGSKIYGELVGYGMSGDAYHITAPDPNGDGAQRSMRMALRHAGATAEDVGYINAHGTSTQLNDKTETAAMKHVLGEAARNIPVSSTKSMIGHTLGAAGAIESLICLLAMRDSKLPPTINLENPDPECDLDYVPNQARDHAFDLCLSNSFGFGGHNVTLAFRKWAG